MRMRFMARYGSLTCGNLAMDESGANSDTFSRGNMCFTDDSIYKKTWPQSVHLYACATDLYLQGCWHESVDV